MTGPWTKDIPINRKTINRKTINRKTINRKKMLERLTQRNQTKSPLLRLPPEIRNRIYDYALSDRVLTHRYTFLDPDSMTPQQWFDRLDNEDYNNSRGSIFNTSPSNVFALTRVCQQLRAETELLVYSLNTVTFYKAAEFEALFSCYPQLEDTLTTVRAPIELVYRIGESEQEAEEPHAARWPKSDSRKAWEKEQNDRRDRMTAAYIRAFRQLGGLEKVILNDCSRYSRTEVPCSHYGNEKKEQTRRGVRICVKRYLDVDVEVETYSFGDRKAKSWGAIVGMESAEA